MSAIGFLCLGTVFVFVFLFMYVLWIATKDVPSFFGVPVSPSKTSVIELNTVAGYLVDPNTKLTAIYVAESVVVPVLTGSATYSELPDKKNTVKLVRSGTGFLVYGHSNIANGKWLSCR